jgi:hypothetical protein
VKLAAVLILIFSFICFPAHAGEVHGASDTYAGEGVAIVWGVLRGASEESTVVVVRVAADAHRYNRVEVAGVDPFTHVAKIRYPVTSLGAGLDLPLPRAGFADHPRTEIRFAGPESLTVYYLSIPDTTPEFGSAAALEAHLAARMAQLRAGKPK